MRTHIGVGFAGLLLIASTLSVSAHHSHPLFYDQCKSVTVEGRVENVLWKNPHVWLDLKIGDGTMYHAEWTSLEGVARIGGLGAAQGALAAGANVVVTGNPARDPARIRAIYPSFKDDPDPKIVDVMQIRRMDESWSWARPDGATPPQRWEVARAVAGAVLRRNSGEFCSCNICEFLPSAPSF